MTRVDHFVGLDLGQAKDYSAVAVVERTQRHADRAERPPPDYTVRHLDRWQLHTPYTQIVRDVAALLWAEPLDKPDLMVDQTGVGAAVVDQFREAKPRAKLRPVLITGGHATTHEAGVWRVPKKELVSVLQLLLQSRRLKVAPLPQREILVAELMAFKVKVSADTGHESFEAWRERDHDDMVLAVCLALWGAERPRPRAGTR